MFWLSMEMEDLISITGAVLLPWTMLYKRSKKGGKRGQRAYIKQLAVVTVSFRGNAHSILIYF